MRTTDAAKRSICAAFDLSVTRAASKVRPALSQLAWPTSRWSPNAISCRPSPRRERGLRAADIDEGLPQVERGLERRAGRADDLSPTRASCTWTVAATSCRSRWRVKRKRDR